MKTFHAFAILCLLVVSSAFAQQPEERFTAMYPEERRLTVDMNARLITILMVQAAGWRDDDEGKKIEPAFRSAALAAFSKPFAPSRNP